MQLKSHLYLFCLAIAGICSIHSSYSQSLSDYCLKGTISTQEDKIVTEAIINLEDSKNTTIWFTLQNCGKDINIVWTHDVSFEDEDYYSTFYFKVYKVQDSSGYMPCCDGKADVEPPFMPDSIGVFPSGSTYKFNLRHVLPINGVFTAGEYRIQGFYRMHLNGFNIVVPTDFIHIYIR